MEKPKQILALEKIIGKELKQVEKIKWNTIGYSIQDNEIIGLGLDGCKIGDAKYLEEFTELENLYLSNNRITDISALKNLKKLTHLVLSINKIQDITSIGSLENLVHLDLRINKISDISALKKLIKLKVLYLYKNQIEDIIYLKELKNLTLLDLENNMINDITSLNHLENLVHLSISNNLITDILPLKGLINLLSLYITKNPIKHLPEWITDFPKMEIFWIEAWKDNALSFYDNPIETPPIDIVKQGKEGIRNYFAQLKKEKEQKYLFEVKLLIIGDGGVGKTSFARKIKDVGAKLPEEQDTTLGIDVSHWNFEIVHPTLGKKIMYANIWDFGGQKLYQGTHQMFFSNKSFYVLIDDTREEKTDFSYWLNTVQQLARTGSKILIVTNKKHAHVTQIDKTGLLGHFGDLIAGFVELDLKNDSDGIIKLQNTLKDHLQNLPDIGSPLPASWVNIRDDLFKEDKKFISFDNYINICKKNNTDLDKLFYLSDYFNRIGVFTHYYEDDLLQERIYLDSNWLVNIIYKVLNHQIVKDKKGRLTEKDIKEIWCDNELYHETAKLTRLMNRFGLMYEIPEKKEFVVPAHLPANQPYIKWQYEENSEVLKFAYEFDKYMPNGIMPRLIVALHRYIPDHIQVWQKGVNLAYHDTYAEIAETYDKNNKYLIRLIGKEKKELLGIINSKFEEILEPFQNLQYEKLVPCTCEECKEDVLPYFFKYSDLIRRKDKGKTTAECEKSYNELNVVELLEGITFSKSTNSLAYRERAGTESILNVLIDKNIQLKQDLILAYDSEKKFALEKQINELEKQIDELKKKL